MLLNVIARPGDAFAAMRHLLDDNHEPRRGQRRHIRAGHRDLPGAAAPAGSSSGSTSRTTDGRTVRLTVDLQLDFALNQPLSPFALAALELLDRGVADATRWTSLSVIESTLEDPRQVLSAQQFKARGEAVAAMKADGIEYEERMELLEEVTYPQAAGGAARRRLRDLPQGPPVGRRPRAGAQVGASATCTSGR